MSPVGRLPFLFLLLLTSYNVLIVYGQRLHRQSRIEEVGEPQQVSEHRRRFHTTGEVDLAMLDPQIDPDGVDEDDFEIILNDGTALSFQGLDLHDDEQEPGVKYWTKENDDMSSVLLVFTDSVFGSKGVHGIIQNATSGMTYEFSGDVVDDTILTDLDIDEVDEYDQEYDPQTFDHSEGTGRDYIDPVSGVAPLPIIIDGVDVSPDAGASSRGLAQLRGSEGDDAAVARRQLQKDDSGRIIDVLVVLTKSAACAIARLGSTCSVNAQVMSKVQSFMNTAFANANEAYRESSINTKARMVHFYVDHNIREASPGWTTLLSQFSNNNSVKQQRNIHGGDFAALIINKGQYCGIGWKPNRASEIHENLGYSMTQWDCATGYLSFAHEIAHNMGCNHDRRNAPAASPGAYNYGYQDPSARFRSVMAYSCPNGSCTRIRRFSGDQSWSETGQRVGNASRENNAKWIRQNLSKYGKFRNMVKPLNEPSSAPTPFPTPKPTPNPVPQTPNPTPQGNQRNFVASMSGTYTGGDGNMFDLRAKNDLQITNLGLHTNTASFTRVQIFKKIEKGTYVGSEFEPSKWEEIGSDEFTALGENKITKLRQGTFSPVPILAGETQAFYITFPPTTKNNRYGEGSLVGDLAKSDENLEFYVGAAIKHLFGHDNNDTWTPRVWNGDIDYELGTFTEPPVSTPSPTPSPTGSPTPVPTSSPTPVPTSSPLPPPTVETPSPTSNRGIILTPFPTEPAPTPPGGGGGPSVRTETTFEGGNGQAGNMFVLYSTAPNPIVIDAFDLHIQSRDEEFVFIYTMEGSFEMKPGSDVDQSMWTAVAQTKIRGRGSPNPTTIPPAKVFAPVTIQPGQNQSFYVSLNATKMRYTNGFTKKMEDQPGPIKMLKSVGKAWSFGATFSPRIWNGAFYWKETGGSTLPTQPPASGGGGGGSAIPRFHATTFTNGNGANGNMFDIKAKSDITITNLHIHVRRTNKVRVKIYKLIESNVSFRGFTEDKSAWQMIGDVSVDGQGMGNPTTLPKNALDAHVTIPAGTVQAFYVTVMGGGLRYTSGKSTSSENYIMHSQSDDLEFYEGVGINGDSFGTVFSPRVFNGIFEYVHTAELTQEQDDATLDEEAESLVEVMEDAAFSYPPGENAEGWPCTSNDECASNHCSAEKAEIISEATLVSGNNYNIDGTPPPQPEYDDYDSGERRLQEMPSRWCLDEHGAHHEDGVN